MEIDKRLIVLLKRSADEIKKTVIGKDDIIIKILMTACAGGHILLEDIPGVGKTTMAVAFSKALSLKYNRMQFTSDVMPADVTGFYMPNRCGVLQPVPGGRDKPNLQQDPVCPS